MVDVFSTHGGTFGAKDAIGSLSSRFQNIDCTVHEFSELSDEGWGSIGSFSVKTVECHAAHLKLVIGCHRFSHYVPRKISHISQ